MNNSRLKDNNYLQISAWMLTELELKGNELLIYALIHGFSQDGKSDFHGSLTYMAAWTNSTKGGVIKVLKSLLAKGIIQKQAVVKNGIQENHYWSSKSREQERESTKFTTTQKTSGQQSLPRSATKFTGGGQQSLPNKDKDNITNSTSSPSKNETKANETQEEAEEFLKTKLKDIFGGHFVFDESFIPQIIVLAESFKLERQRLPDYLDFAFERAKEKKPSSLTNMFFKLAKSPAMMQDFVLSQGEKTAESSAAATCPICGSEAKPFGACPKCGFDMDERNDEKAVSLKRQIFSLPENARLSFQREFDATIKRHNSFGLTALVSNPGLKEQFDSEVNEIYRKYNIAV